MCLTVNDYFAKKAEFYDDVDKQPYWVFSDELLYHLLQNTVLLDLSKSNFRFLDAGAGTARWSKKILDEYAESSAYLIDVSPQMLDVARKKLNENNLIKRANIKLLDLQKIEELDENNFDFAICLHNVIGFIDDTLSVMKGLYNKVCDGGKCAVMFPSFYHAIYFSNSTARFNQAEETIKKRKVRYNDLMPELKVFDLEEIDEIKNESGFKRVSIYGFPLTIYPGMEETYVHGSTERILNFFSNELNRKNLIKLEKSLCLDQKAAARGNNILAVFEK